jgi:hypothetical protein
MSEDFARKNNLYYYECSAKTGHNINEAFKRIADEIYNLSQ